MDNLYPFIALKDQATRFKHSVKRRGRRASPWGRSLLNLIAREISIPPLVKAIILVFQPYVLLIYTASKGSGAPPLYRRATCHPQNHKLFSHLPIPYSYLGFPVTVHGDYSVNHQIIKCATTSFFGPLFPLSINETRWKLLRHVICRSFTLDNSPGWGISVVLPCANQVE